MDTFGKALRQIRINKGLSLKELGERCDPPTDPGYLSKLENGKIGVGEEMINRLSAALDVSPKILQELAEKTSQDKTLQFYASLLENTPFSKEVFLIKNWGKLKEIAQSPEKAKWEALLPVFGKQERIPSELRFRLIEEILSLELSEVEYFLEVISSYRNMKVRLDYEKTIK